MGMNTNDGPNYDVAIDADTLLADLADRAADYGRDYEEKRGWWTDSFDACTRWHEAEHWMHESLGGRRAYQRTITQLQPGGRFRNDDGTVAVRELMAWLSRRADEAHEASYGPYHETRQADEAETAYAKMLSVLRDDYGIGWPRLDDVLGTALECDLP